MFDKIAKVLGIKEIELKVIEFILPLSVEIPCPTRVEKSNSYRDQAGNENKR